MCSTKTKTSKRKAPKFANIFFELKKTKWVFFHWIFVRYPFCWALHREFVRSDYFCLIVFRTWNNNDNAQCNFWIILQITKLSNICNVNKQLICVNLYHHWSISEIDVRIYYEMFKNDPNHAKQRRPLGLLNMILFTAPIESPPQASAVWFSTFHEIFCGFGFVNKIRIIGHALLQLSLSKYHLWFLFFCKMYGKCLGWSQ